jgi:peroxin-19
MDIMQEVQEYGQPPAEIIREIAPGIELDEDGAPKMEECSIM